MPAIRIVHNPRCSKSRQTLQLLVDRSLDIEIIEYLKQPLSAQQISTLIEQLGFQSARQLMRTKETEFKAMGLQNTELSEQELISAMVESPKLIERPIVIHKNQARIGRPPENVLDIL